MSELQKFRWGIMATGRISKQFAQDLQTHIPDAVLTAVGSRSQASADAFADQFNIPNRHTDYAAVANDPDVDVVYIGTPNNLHYENVKACLNAGKAVLCEKPFMLNSRQAQELVDLAQKKNVFLMEALWTRFLPMHKALHEFVQRGGLGEVRMVQANFGFRAAFDPTNRLFDPVLGGGALLDVGVYVLAFAIRYLGMPTHISGFADVGATGVDEQAGYVLGYPSGATAVLTSAVRTHTYNEATLIGTKGRARVHERFHEGTVYTTEIDGVTENHTIPLEESGLQYQAMEVHRCLRAGLVQSPGMPHDDTLAIARVMDNLRAQWGITFPGE
jgi:predicted dehydrogenase